MNRAFSASAFATTASWGAAPGCYERCAFGAIQIPCRFSVSAKKRTGAPELGCDRVNLLLGRLSILDPSPQLWGEPAFEGGSEFDFIVCFGYFFSTGRREAGFGVSF